MCRGYWLVCLMATGPWPGNDGGVGRMRGWPATLTEADLLDVPVGLRPCK